MSQPSLTRIPSIMKEGGRYVVKRWHPGKYQHGEYERGECVQFEIIANIQPLTGFNLLHVPEGERHKRHLDVFTQTRLNMKDVVVYQGLDHEVIFAQDWGVYTRATIRLQDTQENR